MTEPSTTISVRGTARHVVPPDRAVLHTSVYATAVGKREVLEQAGRAQAAVLDALRERGGVALAVESRDASLTWSTRSFSANERWDYDQNGQRSQAGWEAQVPITITLRDLTLLPDLAAAVLAIADLRVEGVRWEVDPRNPAWPVVRAAAIQDAIARARDYATALDGSITALVHVADEGLLGGENRVAAQHGRGFAMDAALMSDGVMESGGGEGPVLDPQPQQIHATIEARFVATVAALP